MKIGIRHDESMRKAIDSVRVNWLLNKSVYRNKNASKQQRATASTKLTYIAKKRGSITKLVNYCVQTGESHSIMTKFKRNRHIVREIALRGRLPGVIKASW